MNTVRLTFAALTASCLLAFGGPVAADLNAAACEKLLAGIAPATALETLLEPLDARLKRNQWSRRDLEQFLSERDLRNFRRYAPRAEVLDRLNARIGADPTATAAKAKWKLLREADVAELLEQNFDQLTTTTGEAPDRRALLAYYLILHDERTWSDENLVGLSRTLFPWLGSSRESAAVKTAQFVNLIQFLAARWDQKATEDTPTLRALVRRVVATSGGTHRRVLRALALEYLAGRPVPSAQREFVGEYLAEYLELDDFLVAEMARADVSTARAADLLELMRQRGPRTGARESDENLAGLARALPAVFAPNRGVAFDLQLLQTAAAVWPKTKTDLLDQLALAFVAAHPGPAGMVAALDVYRQSKTFAVKGFVKALLTGDGVTPDELQSRARLMRENGYPRNKADFAGLWPGGISIPLRLNLGQNQEHDIATLDLAQWFGDRLAPVVYYSVVTTYLGWYPADLTRVLKFTHGTKAFAVTDLLEHGWHIELPPPRDLAAQLDVVARTVPSELEKVRAMAATLVRKTAALSSAERNAYARVLPELRDKVGEQLVDLFAGRVGADVEIPVAQVLRHQGEFDRALMPKLQEYIDANAPPEPLGWMDLIRRLPQSERYPFTKKILARNASTTARVATAIRALEPEDGVREAVQDFLNASPHSNGNRSAFEPAQITRMFGGGSRFRRFFPQIGPHSQVDSGTMRTHYIMAVRTARGGSLNTEWAIEKLLEENLRTGVHATLGYRPILSYARLLGLLNGDFGNIEMVSPAAQVRGAIVQGAYERQGFSAMERLTTRGDAQVEEQAGPLNTQIETSLGSGVLSRQTPLLQRLFVYAWSLTASTALISNIRDRAVWIAGEDENFWRLRVEIHNFPNQDILERVRRYQRAYRYADEVDRQLLILIGELERLLTRGKTPQADLDATIDELLGASDEMRAQLKTRTEDFANRTLADQLDVLAQLRHSWRELRLADEGDGRRRLDAYVGDRTLSEFTTALVAKGIATLARPTTPAEIASLARLVTRIIDHVRLDDMLTPGAAKHLDDAIERVVAAPDVDVRARGEMLLSLMQNAIDQVHHALAGEFGRFDQITHYLVRHPAGAGQPVPFVDDTLRSSNVFMLAKLAEIFQRPTEVYNAGRAIGTLRLNASPAELTAGDIAFFETLPTQLYPVAGILSTAIGSRLSHVQLLAKSLGVPNVKIDADFVARLRALKDQRVVLTANPDHSVDVRLATEEAPAPAAGPGFVLPPVDHRLKMPLSFAEAAAVGRFDFAGPKGLNLVRLFADPELRAVVPDGVILPFGFFDRYARAAQHRWPFRLLKFVDVDNKFLVARLATVVREYIDEMPIPEAMMNEIMAQLYALRARTGSDLGFFVRSDTNVEDLPEFNGAGLNESVPNVNLDADALNRAIRRVWASAYSERSISWRARATRGARVVLAEPSVVIQTTVAARSSGVILSRGTDQWLKGRGVLSANWGIGSVVEAHAAVEEFTLASGAPLRLGYSVSNRAPTADAEGGLTGVAATPGTPVLSDSEVARLNELAQKVDDRLGDQPRGWDIEWAIAEDGVKILQARPNF